MYTSLMRPSILFNPGNIVPHESRNIQSMQLKDPNTPGDIDADMHIFILCPVNIPSITFNDAISNISPLNMNNQSNKSETPPNACLLPQTSPNSEPQ